MEKKKKTGSIIRKCIFSIISICIEECEQLLQNTFSHMECICGGTDEKLCVYIVTHEINKNSKDRRNANEEIAENVIRILCKKTGLHRNAIEVKQVEKIPKNESGKVMYKYLHL